MAAIAEQLDRHDPTTYERIPLVTTLAVALVRFAILTRAFYETEKKVHEAVLCDRVFLECLVSTGKIRLTHDVINDDQATPAPSSEHARAAS